MLTWYSHALIVGRLELIDGHRSAADDLPLSRVPAATREARSTCARKKPALLEQHVDVPPPDGGQRGLLELVRQSKGHLVLVQG